MPPATRREQRSRSLPARVMAYFAVGMALHADGSYEDVLYQITDGLSWGSGWVQEYRPPGMSAIFQARARLGHEPVRALFERFAVPLAAASTPGAWLAGRRLVAVDGFCLDLPDTSVNDEFFGRKGVNKGERAAFPMARVVALAECATHAVFAAEVGAYRQSEATLVQRLLPVWEPGMLVLADRGMFSYGLWAKAQASGADLLWRIRTDAAGPQPVFVQDLPDGSWLGRLQRARPKIPGEKQEPMLVRVIDYRVDDGRDNEQEYRLFTTILDPALVDAVDLAAAYRQRWEIETTFDQLKTHQRGPRMILRSRSPDLVLQEIWGHLCCHYAIRCLMLDTAATAGVDPDRISFVAALRIARQSLAGVRSAGPSDFSPCQSI